MAQLTATKWDVIFDLIGGIRKMADEVNLAVCDLYENELHPKANIIALDFIKGSRLTDMAIAWNKKWFK